MEILDEKNQLPWHLLLVNNQRINGKTQCLEPSFSSFISSLYFARAFNWIPQYNCVWRREDCLCNYTWNKDLLNSFKKKKKKKKENRKGQWKNKRSLFLLEKLPHLEEFMVVQCTKNFFFIKLLNYSLLFCYIINILKKITCN